MKKFIIVLLLTLVFFLIYRYSLNEENLNGEKNNYRNLVKNANKNGTIRVIIMLKLPTKVNIENNKDKEKLVKNAQDKLKKEMQNNFFINEKRFRITPGLAATVDSKTLKILITSPLVENITEEVPVPLPIN